MTTIVVLNLVLSAFVIFGVLSLLTWGILGDRGHRTAPLTGRRRAVTARSAQRSGARLGRALRLGA